MRLLRLARLLPALAATLAQPGVCASAPVDSVATYRIRMDPAARRFVVSATLPIAGRALRTDATRPAGIAELDSLGWAGLVRDLRVTDAGGRPLTVAPNQDRGWALPAADTTTLRLDYEVDLTPLEKLGWPAPREAAFADADRLVLVGRALFVTTAATRKCRVAFELPEGWSATTPWRSEGGPSDLVENLLVLSRRPHETVVAENFHLHVIPFGHWETTKVRPVLERIVRSHVALWHERGRVDYLVVLLPQLESGGESYRSAFAMNTNTPGPTGLPAWANLVAHEVFHYWNGWMLRGADYASTQWFQEGFTEYAGNLAVARSGAVDKDWLRTKLAAHVENARKLTTTLDSIGTRKGPPLYSAGALVAFTWDVRIRKETNGTRDLGDFLRALLRNTNGGARGYAWPDLEAALQEVAPGDWAAFHVASIHGRDPIPVESALADVGQELFDDTAGVRVVADPKASAEAQRRWAALVGNGARK